jgi:hypothetical protein
VTLRCGAGCEQAQAAAQRAVADEEWHLWQIEPAELVVADDEAAWVMRLDARIGGITLRGNQGRL